MGRFGRLYRSPLVVHRGGPGREEQSGYFKYIILGGANNLLISVTNMSVKPLVILEVMWMGIK